MKQDFQTFLRMNEKRIHFQIHRLHIHQSEHEEYYSEGIVALWQAYQTYDETKGEIGTYINYRIRFKLLDLLRKKIRMKENDESMVEGTKTMLTNGTHMRHTATPLPDMTDELIRHTYMYHEKFWQMIQAKLSKNQWKWVKYFIIAELTVKEIMEIENVTADAVKGWGRAVREKLRQEEILQQLKDYLYD